jgi:hypothetical protein
MHSISELEAWAARFYPQGQRLLLIPYGYPVTFATVAAAGTQTQTLAITANADFVHTSTAFRANIAGAVQTSSSIPIPNWRLLITDSGTNEQFTSAQMDLSNFASKGFAYSMEHPYPRIISGRSTLTLQVTSFEAAQTYSVDIALLGVLVRVLSN